MSSSGFGFKLIKKILYLNILLLLLSVSGCSTISYYFNAVNGHLAILADQESISEILQQHDLDPELRRKLQLVLQARDFATSELKLPDNDSYRYYVDIDRPFVVWNVIAAEKYSVEAKKWCFLIVGCVSYRGYFNEADATEYAQSLQQQGLDVYVSGARAYSTLGWLDDPLLNTMLQTNDARIVGLIFHELAHQEIYINNDTGFNEAFASSVEIAGIQKWFSTKSDSKNNPLFNEYLAARQREIGFKQLLKNTRMQLKDLYQSERFNASDSDSGLKAQLKHNIYIQLQLDYKKLKLSWQGYSGYDAWFARDLNNAHLALIATYSEKVPQFQALLLASNNNFEQFYIRVADIGALEKQHRNKRLLEISN